MFDKFNYCGYKPLKLLPAFLTVFHHGLKYVRLDWGSILKHYQSAVLNLN